tara:strand:- start:404 stop:511 length:108 start_codon:yes stop_codon:yes gene_type:complete
VVLLGLVVKVVSMEMMVEDQVMVKELVLEAVEQEK